MQMNFTLDGGVVSFEIGHCTVAGWTGRDTKAIQHHIDELAAIGVKPPSTVPLYYRTSFGMLTQAPVIEVVGKGTSGEVEPLVIAKDGVLYLGLASDHTDRELEAHSVALSKQICAKPVANTIWKFDDVADHLEQIELKSWIREGDSDEWVPYQEGTIASIRPLSDLIEGSGLKSAGTSGKAAAMLCGTFGAKGRVRPARSFKMTMHDPVRGLSITHSYDIVELPEIA
ncbi:DUF2848 domain-containing protein [Thalassospira xiamenensis]|uniref:DUF2848 domain-containing protein n=1 Tax=Thalassospira xiamenensis TaxID=220697 RepID=A0ABR5Y4Z1_9PROT|nr:DUF2848 domain-containing protein [Thalassospira xiamenensis]KZD05778.1 hypothetical protein AUP40_12330 [Thalassospira xiamenensis]KZD09534.1 hypothetical protein AUP45_12630 [Thalassospira xiamenensis]